MLSTSVGKFVSLSLGLLASVWVHEGVHVDLKFGMCWPYFNVIDLSRLICWPQFRFVGLSLGICKHLPKYLHVFA